MAFFINDALAAAAAAQPAKSDSMMSLLMMVGIFVLFYFMLIRPQSKRAKEHQKLTSKLAAGDEIITSGGIMAKVVALNGEQYLDLMIAKDVVISVQRSAVSTLLPKGTIAF